MEEDKDKHKEEPVVPEILPVNQVSGMVTNIIRELANGIKSIVQPKWYKYAFDLLIILAVITPVTILGIKGILTENTLGTLFGGIIGYTLSRFRKQNL